MSTQIQHYRLTFEAGVHHTPCLWKMSRQIPSIAFDIRSATIQRERGLMSVRFEGDAEDIQAAANYLRELGVKVQECTAEEADDA